jgi:hypothetical protein
MPSLPTPNAAHFSLFSFEFLTPYVFSLTPFMHSITSVKQYFLKS